MNEFAEKPELYHPDILAYARNPARWRKEHDAQYIIKAYNPVCGDKFEIRFDVDHVIVDTSFFGYGCVVSKASIAVMTDILLGLPVSEARVIIESYVHNLNESDFDQEIDNRLAPFLIARKYPGRIQCATLGWKALLHHEPFIHIL